MPRAVLWELLLLLLLCVCARARGDCRGDCGHCGRLAPRHRLDLLICVLECEGQAVPRATWELCAATLRAWPRARRPSGRAWPWGASPWAQPHPQPHAQPQQQQQRRRRQDEEEEEEEEGREDVWRRRAGAAPGVQKRYGGFIGVRKSARKWNNQKRFSEFLKQYLGMAPRSSEYGRGTGTGTGDANEI